MGHKDEIKSVEIFAGTAWQAEMLKSILAVAEIDAFVLDEIIGTLSPWWTAPGGAGSVRVVVSSLDAEKAKLIVEEFEKNLK